MRVQRFYNNQITLIHGDCLEAMWRLRADLIDFVFADLPYAKTANRWDMPLNLAELWAAYRHVGKPTTPYTFTASNGFEFELYASNPKQYRYKWVWFKNNSAGFALAKKRPLNTTEDVLVFGDTSLGVAPQPVPLDHYIDFDAHEDIMVFGDNGIPYNPLMVERGKIRHKVGYSKSGNYSNLDPSKVDIHNNLYYPKSLINIPNASQVGKYHATQKPIELMEYLIRTYTREGDLVLDNTMGVGSTALACMRCNRRFIGIELYPLPDQEITDSRGANPNNYGIAVQRVLGALD